MTNRTHNGLLMLVLVTGLAGCDGARESAAPTAPTTPTRPTATLSGLVFVETPTGLTPIENAKVRLEVGSYRQDSLTDQSGRYRLTELYDGSSSVITSREGYDTETRSVTIKGDVVLDIRITPQVPHTLSGEVFEMTPSGRVPLDGALVHWSDGHTDYYTASDGLFTFSDVRNGVTSLMASKEGYGTVFLQATVRGDTRFDIQLVRR